MVKLSLFIFAVAYYDQLRVICCAYKRKAGQKYMEKLHWNALDYQIIFKFISISKTASESQATFFYPKLVKKN